MKRTITLIALVAICLMQIPRANAVFLFGGLGSGSTSNGSLGIAKLTIPSGAQGDLLYYTGTAITRLPKGTDGFVLASNGSTGKPYWITAGGTGTVTSINGKNGDALGAFTGGPVTASGTLTYTHTVNSFSSKYFQNGGIQSVDLANGSVINTKVGANAVTTDKVSNGAITLPDISTAVLSANGARLIDDLTFALMKTTLSLNNVENTALSTWAGTSNITTLGTVGTGEWSGTAINISNGGTGATTALAARSALGLAIGSSVQAWDTDLDTWASKTPPSGATVGTTDSQTLTNKTIAGAILTGVTTLNGNTISLPSLTQGDQLFSKIAGSLTRVAKGANHTCWKTNGNALTWEACGGTASTPGGSNTFFQFNDSSSFGGNGALAFTKGTKTLAIAADAPLDINSTTVSIADTNITFDGASTTFTGTGTMTVVPGSGTDLINTIASGGEFKINTSDVVFNGRTANVGIATANPSSKLDVTGTVKASGQINGGTANFTTGAFTNISTTKMIASGSVNGANLTATALVKGNSFNINGNSLSIGTINQGGMLVSKVTGALAILNNGANHSCYRVNGNVAVWESCPIASASATAWDTIADPSGSGAISMVESVQTLDWNTNDVTSPSNDFFQFTLQNDGVTDVTTQRLLTLENKVGTTGTTEVMQRILNSSSATATNALLIDGTVFTTALNVSDVDIVTGLALGENTVTVNGRTLTAIEFGYLDGITSQVASLNDTQTFTNKTFTAPVLGVATGTSLVTSGKVVAGSNVNGTTANFTKVLASSVVNGTVHTGTKFLSSGTVNGTSAIFTTGNVGIGILAPSVKLQVNGATMFKNSAGFNSEFNIGNGGTAKTVDWNNGNRQLITLNGSGACVLTFTAPTSMGATSLQLRIIQGARSGIQTITFPATVKWPSGTAPTLSVANGDIDLAAFSFVTGPLYYGFSALKFQ